MELEELLLKRKSNLERRMYGLIKTASVILYDAMDKYNSTRDAQYLINAASYIVTISKYLRELSGEYVATVTTYDFLVRLGRVPNELIESLDMIDISKKYKSPNHIK